MGAGEDVESEVAAAFCRPRADTIRGYAGNDVLRGRRGGDLLYGGRGADRLYGGKDWSPPDVPYGRAGNDHFYVTDMDVVCAGRGNDVIVSMRFSVGVFPISPP